jgi:hypothetical protein
LLVNFRQWRALRFEKRRDVARIIIAELEIGHGCRGGIGLRILDPGEQPLPRGLFGNVPQRRRVIRGGDARSVWLHDSVAPHASVASDQLPAQVQLRRALHGAKVTLTAGRLEISRRQHRLFPCLSAAVSFFDRGGRALSTMADHTTEVSQRMRNWRMRAVRLLAHAGQTGFFQGNVACRAAIDHAHIRQPNLFEPGRKMAL